MTEQRPLKPPKAPNECCTKPENLTDRVVVGTGKAKDPSGQEFDMQSGYRTCTVCGRKHYYMQRLEPLNVNITPIDTL